MSPKNETYDAEELKDENKSCTCDDSECNDSQNRANEDSCCEDESKQDYKNEVSEVDQVHELVERSGKKKFKIGTCSDCEIFGEEEQHAESFFEKNFVFFMIPAAIILAFSISIEFFLELSLISQILAISSMVFSGYGVFKLAISDIVNKRITANVLMVIAAIASFFIVHGQEGAVAIFLFALATRIEDMTTEKSRTAITELLELAPDEAMLKTREGYRTIRTNEVKLGNIIGVKSGMKAPLDGIIVKGTSYFDESAITGESIPVLKKEGDEIFAASINTDSYVEIEVTRESSNTIVAQIAESIKLAQQNKSKKEKFIEKFAKYYTPLILTAAILVMIIPPLIFGLDFNDWIYRGLILLVVSCPCALTLSTPLANINALAKLAREGIFVKGNRFIEEINDIKAFAFDKTGTLTEGNLRVFDIISYDGNKQHILSKAASLEVLSEHPIGKAITAKAKQMELSLLSVDNFKVLKGKGIQGEIDGELYVVGSQRFFEERKYKLPITDLNRIEETGTIPILLGKDEKIIGIITIRDVLRVSAPVLIAGLKKRGYDSVLISGDSQLVSDTIGESLDIGKVYGELLPDQKLKKIETLKNVYNGVAMVGDGINDAPALARSDVGVAIGASATDLTLETADVVIMTDDLTKLITLVDIAKKTNKKIKQNIWTSILVKVSFAILTVIGLMTLWLAVGIGDMGVSLLVLLNGMSIFRYQAEFKDVSNELLESKTQLLACETCKTMDLIPQHHGRDMLQQGETLVCWRKLLISDDVEPCEVEIPLLCPQCKNILEIS
jgi:Cd2+/Zn2+-exporting ATPase